MNTKKLTKLLALYLPYVLLGLVATNIGEAWRLAEGKELGDKIMAMMGTLPVAFANPLPSLHPLDLIIGLSCGAGLRLAVYLRSKNAKKYRHGMEYGSARWGNAKDIEPFQAPKFADNIILTKTERLMMSNRPPDPKNARNKNVQEVGLQPEARLTAAGAAHHQHAIHHFHHALHFPAEIRVSGSIHNIDRVSIPEDGCILGLNRDALFSFQIHGIHGAFLHGLVSTVGASRLQKLVNQGRLPMVNVSDNGEVAELGRI